MKYWGDSLALISCDAAVYADAIAAHCADVILLPPCAQLDRRIAAHPDTLTAQLGDALIMPAAYAAAEEIADILRRRCRSRVILSEYMPGARYPQDVGCNLLRWDRFAYGLTAHLAPEIAPEAAEQGIVLRNVKQGYAACSALSCDAGVISADCGILRAAAMDGADTLTISSDGIFLEGYGCGFIGGASGCTANAAAFFGDPASHPDGHRIIEWLEARGVQPVPLKRGPLHDFGGIRFVRLAADDNFE